MVRVSCCGGTGVLLVAWCGAVVEACEKCDGLWMAWLCMAKCQISFQFFFLRYADWSGNHFEWLIRYQKWLASCGFFNQNSSADWSQQSTKFKINDFVMWPRTLKFDDTKWWCWYHVIQDNEYRGSKNIIGQLSISRWIFITIIDHQYSQWHDRTSSMHTFNNSMLWIIFEKH